MLVLAAVLSTMQYDGVVTAEGGDYAEVMFEVPAGTREIQIAHSDGAAAVILDFGVWDQLGEFRGWGGGNAEDIVIGVAESSRSYRIGPIVQGTWTVVIGKARLDPITGASYSLAITCRDDDTLPLRPRAPYTPVVRGTEQRWYKGDFHVHSSESGDADASYAEIAALARSRGLDFVVLSEHNTDAQLPLQAAAQADIPDVLLLRGAEITTYAGHANAVGLPAYVNHRIGLRGRTIQQIVDDVVFHEALFIVNHPVLDLGDTCIGCSWDHPDTPWDQVNGLEIITGKWELVEQLFVGRAIALWDEQLAAGHRIAAIGGSDDHRAGTGTSSTDTPIGSPTTLVLATGLTEESIRLAVLGGRTIVQLRGPDDPFVDFKMGELTVGDHLTNVQQVAATVTVAGAQGMAVQLWRDGELIAVQRIDSTDFTHTFRDVPGPVNRRYRVELVDAGGQRIVVTSHIYVDGVLDDSSDGCSAAQGGGSLLALGVIGIGLALSRRRRTASHRR